MSGGTAHSCFGVGGTIVPVTTGRASSPNPSRASALALSSRGAAAASRRGGDRLTVPPPCATTPPSLLALLQRLVVLAEPALERSGRYPVCSCIGLTLGAAAGAVDDRERPHQKTHQTGLM